MTLQLGVYSFGNTPRTDDGSYGPTAQAIRNVLEAVHLAEEVGLDFFGFGEHHTRSMPLSSPTALVNAPDHTVSLWTESPRVRYSSLTLEKEFQCRQKRTP